MALKGSAVIELTDVKTGKKEIVKHDNLVTNAVNDILSIDPFNMRFGSDISQYGVFFPIISRLIGGVVLFEDPLEEDPNKYFAPETNDVIGYSNMDVSPSDDPKRGSLNQSESGKLEDGKGYRFVFDFATSQGNGEISALALTSQSMGGCGYGSKQFNNYSGNNQGETSPFAQFRRMSSTSVDIGAVNARRAASIVSIDFENRVAYAVEPKASKKLAVYKFELVTDNIGLFTTALFRFSTPSIVAELSTDAFLPTYITNTGDNNVGFCDGGDGFIWGFQLSGNTSSGTSVMWVKINKTDWSLEEGSWTLPIAISRPGLWREIAGSSSSRVCTNCLVHNGYAYFIQSDMYGLLIINTENPSDITVVDTQYKVSEYDNTECYSRFNTMGDVVVFPGGYVADKITHPGYQYVTTSSSYRAYGLRATARPNIRVGPYLFSLYFFQNNYIYLIMQIDSSYLATINNLEKPVQKTADKTMKITYILREE